MFFLLYLYIPGINDFSGTLSIFFSSLFSSLANTFWMITLFMDKIASPFGGSLFGERRSGIIFGQMIQCKSRGGSGGVATPAANRYALGFAPPGTPRRPPPAHPQWLINSLSEFHLKNRCPPVLSSFSVLYLLSFPRSRR